MNPPDTKQSSSRPPRRNPANIVRRRRFAGANSVVATLLAAALAVVINVGSSRLYLRLPVASHLHGTLSHRTQQLLRHTDGDIRLTAFFAQRHPLTQPVRALLQEFTEAARTIPNLRIKAVGVDPVRDVIEAGEIARKYGAQPNSLIVSSESNHRVLTEEDLLSNPDFIDEGEIAGHDFTGEAALASAIWNATRARNPIIYFLTGNGEHDPFDYDQLTGYSTAGRYLQQDGFELRQLTLGEGQPVPDDCAILIVAGPRAEIGRSAAEQIDVYMTTGGRMLLMLDSLDDPNLRRMVENWGVRCHAPLAKPGARIGMEASNIYGDHPIARGLARIELVLQAPCRFAILPDADAGAGHADKPHATPLVFMEQSGRVRPDDADDEEAQARILAVAAERGLAGAREGASLARIVIVGDAQFAANSTLNGGYDGNRDFFMSTIDWLSEQEMLIGRMPVTFRVLRAGIPGRSWRRMGLLVVVFWPGCVWLTGTVLTYRRRSGQRQ